MRGRWRAHQSFNILGSMVGTPLRGFAHPTHAVARHGRRSPARRHLPIVVARLHRLIIGAAAPASIAHGVALGVPAALKKGAETETVAVRNLDIERGLACDG